MRLLSRLIVSAIALLPGAGIVRAEEARLTLLHTTDLHGSLLAWDDLAERPAIRGLEKIATLVRAARADGQPTVLIDAGDCIQGTPLATVHQLGNRARPDPMMSAMNLIGYDALVVGNHEFDFGPAAIEAARKSANFPWLSANVLQADGRPAFAPSLVKTVGALKIGIVGVTTPITAAWLDSTRIGGLTFGSPVDAARREVERLRNDEKCDLVILVAHTGLERDPETGAERAGELEGENWAWKLANDVKNVDALVIGHTHVVIPQAAVGGTLVAQAGARGEGLGRIDFVLQRDDAKHPWKIASRTGRYLAVADSTESDSAIVKLGQPYRVSAAEEMARVIRRTNRTIGSPAGRLADGPLWELIHDVQLQGSGAEVSLAGLPDPYQTVGPGSIMVRDLYRLFPYENPLVVLDLSGAELKSVLEHSARTYAPWTPDAGASLFDPERPDHAIEAAEGVTYEVDLTRPPGDRVMHLARNHEPIDPSARIRVVTTLYRASGANGYDMLRKARRVATLPRTLRELMIARLANTASPLAARYERNWTVIPDYLASPERGLIGRLVRQGALPPADVMRIDPASPARRGDLAYWIARAYGWREKRFSGAFADLPDSLEPWLDGLLKRKVLGESGSGERFEPFRPVPVRLAVDWCEGAAHAAGYALAVYGEDPVFRRSLLTGLGLSGDAMMRGDTLTQSQALAMVANLRYPSIRVLATSDFHGAILGGNRERRTNRPIGGAAALAATIARLRAQNPDGTVLLDGGDWMQGTMISNLAYGRPVIEHMNALGYTAAVIGNHEFDWTADTLIRRVHELHFSALGANMKERKNGKMPRWVRSDTMVVRRGLRIGIIGLCYPFTPTVTLPSNVAHLKFEDDSTTAAPIAKRLRGNGKADLVVGVGHIPSPTDSLRRPRGDLARLTRVAGVDAWFGGHSHNLVVGEANGITALIPGSHGNTVGVADLVVDPVANKVVERSARLETVYADFSPDTATQTRIVRWNSSVAEIAAQPVGRNTTALLRGGSENLVGHLVTDAIRQTAGVDIVFQNSGGLRADLPAGVVTRGMIYEVMPFENTVVTMRLRGSQVRRAIEEGLRSGRVVQASGIRFVYDLDAPQMSRVIDLANADGTPFDTTRTYKVAVNNFMAEGGDSYEVFRDATDKVDTQAPVRDRLEQYVREQSRDGRALDVRPDGRIRRK